MTATLISIRQAIEEKSARLGLPSHDHVRRVERLSTRELLDCAMNLEPVIITDEAKDWPICELTVEELCKEMGDLPVEPRVGDYISVAFSKERSFQPMLLREYVDLITRPNPAWEVPPYVGNHVLPPALRDRITAPRWYPEAAYTEPRMWLGPAGTVTPLHSDMSDNVFLQVIGRKHFTLFPPHAADRLYTWNPSEVITGTRFNPDNPDFEACPLSRDAPSITCELAAGEILFLPGLWFHHVRALDLSLSINFFVANIRPLAAFPPGTKLWDD